MPYPSYSDAISRLNQTNLSQAFEFVCLLSVLEFEGGPTSPFYPLLNSEQVRLLAEAVVKSKAAWYKDRPIQLKDVSTLLNGANEGLKDNRLEKDVKSGGERQEMLYQLARVLARMAYMQIRPQNTFLIALGRTLGMLEAIPQNHLEEFEPHLQQQVQSFSVRVREILGSSVSELVRTHLLVLLYFDRVGQDLLQRLPRTRPGQYMPPTWKTRVLGDLILSLANEMEAFRITQKRLSDVLGEAVPSLDQYVQVFARGISTHRDLLKKVPYQVGPEGHSLSPLERFPLVADDSGKVWYVPNVRLLARSASDVIHFTLNETALQEYLAVKGAILEVYIRLMITRRVPHLIIIPEGKWKSSKGEMRGPDIIIVDHSDDPVVIAMEIKSRLMVPATRFQLSDEDLVRNYEDLWKALKMLPEKMVKVFASSGDYARYEECLSKAQAYPVFYLGVAGEAPYLFGELTDYRRRNDPAFPLYGFTEPAGVMSVDTFERMLEVSVQHGRSIAGVLRDYLDDCSQMDPSEPMAEDFRRVSLDSRQSFGSSFLNLI